MFRDSVKGSDYYHLGKKPLIIGVSGGLSSGKSTFVNALSGLFGDEQVLQISEDSYYNWRPASPMWKTLTSLDPRSSRLSQMIYDLQSILDSKIFKGYAYNRKHKKFIYKTSQNTRQVVLLDSPFALHSKQLVEMEDVSFFLEIDSSFEVDSGIVNQNTDQIAKQKADFKKYIQPQKAQADIVYTLSPVNPEIKELELLDSKINLNIVFKDGLYHQELLRVLTGVCGLQVNIKQPTNLSVVEIDIQGDVDAEDIKFASKIITPGLNEFLNDEYGFHGGKLGLMQLIALVEINHALKRRKRQGAC
jgi:uridine kinase